MFENIINFIKSHIAILISLISLMLSLYNFVYNFVCRKCKLQIIVHKHLSHNNTHQFYITVQNQSQLPISISSICINNQYFCVLEPALIKETIRHTGNTVTSRTETKTIPFPINLNTLQSYSGYLEFRDIDTFDENNFSISIFTNRRAIKNVNFITSDDLTKML